MPHGSAGTGPVHVIGDVHGERDKLIGLLREAGLVSGSLRWSGGNATLWCIGDLTDRGPDGSGVVELMVRLSAEAGSAGGRVECLFGNHEAMLLGAHRFGDATIRGLRLSFLELWRSNGGSPRDLQRLEPHHLAWLSRLPAMALVADHLLVHADATVYRSYGRRIEEVNARMGQVVGGHDPIAWAELVDGLCERYAFEGSPQGAARFLETFGGRRIVHGHTPIPYITPRMAKDVVGPHVYADGLCVNVDGGMYAGGPGFLWTISEG